jgi:hypothetical protein
MRGFSECSCRAMRVGAMWPALRVKGRGWGRTRGAHHPDPTEGVMRPAGAAPPAQRRTGYGGRVPLGPPTQGNWERKQH